MNRTSLSSGVVVWDAPIAHDIPSTMRWPRIKISNATTMEAAEMVLTRSKIAPGYTVYFKTAEIAMVAKAQGVTTAYVMAALNSIAPPGVVVETM